MMQLVGLVLSSLLGWYLKRYAKNEQAKKDFIKFNEVMFSRGLTKTKLRLDSLNQIKEVKEMWKNENR